MTSPSKASFPANPSPTSIDVEIDASLDGYRLDRALASLISDRSRALIQKHIEVGAVTLNGLPPRQGAKTTVHRGDQIRYTPPAPAPIDVRAEPIPLSILYEDETLIVIDKPAGLVVHPAVTHPTGTLVAAILHHLGVDHLGVDHLGVGHLGLDDGGVDDGPAEAQRGAVAENLRPGIVHRLDKDTTGVIVVAKTPRAQELLSLAFKERRVEKEYLAIVRGLPRPKSGTIDTLYGRHPRQRKLFSSKVIEGKRAITHYEVKATYLGASQLSVRIETGRTHQIRVHLADSGWPIVGDPVYGRKRATKDPRIKHILDTFARPALHAARLAFVHPETGERLAFEAPVPKDLTALIGRLEQIERP